jgi:hypothetical protein
MIDKRTETTITTSFGATKWQILAVDGLLLLAYTHCIKIKRMLLTSAVNVKRKSEFENTQKNHAAHVENSEVIHGNHSTFQSFGHFDT